MKLINTIGESGQRNEIDENVKRLVKRGGKGIS